MEKDKESSLRNINAFFSFRNCLKHKNIKD